MGGDFNTRPSVTMGRMLRRRFSFVFLAFSLLVVAPKIGALDGFPPVPVAICALGMLSITFGTIWQKRTAGSVDLRTNAVVQYVGAAAVTLPPTVARILTSTPSPSAAIDTTVRNLVMVVSGPTISPGTTSSDRNAASARKPRMNQGTRRKNPARFLLGAPPPRRGASSESPTTSGPSISTRISFTSVPIWVLTSPAGTVAASTCGTA